MKAIVKEGIVIGYVDEQRMPDFASLLEQRGYMLIEAIPCPRCYGTRHILEGSDPHRFQLE